MKLHYLTNDHSFAIYNEAGELLVTGQHDDDPAHLIEGLGFQVEHGRFKDMDGASAPKNLADAIGNDEED